MVFGGVSYEKGYFGLEFNNLMLLKLFLVVMLKIMNVKMKMI
jgi:hypothetical protein